MKKSLKALALISITGALMAGSAFAASAAQTGTGEWCEGESGWWYEFTQDGSDYAKDGWYYIQNADGEINCYLFDADGWLQVSTESDGYTIGEDGRYMVDGAAVAYSADEVSYTAAGTLAEAAEAAEADAEDGESSEATSSTETEEESTVTTADLLGLNKDPVASSSSTNAIVAGGAYSSSDDPANMTAEYDFTYSTIDGSTASNYWSGFRMSLPGKPTKGGDDHTDWYYEGEDIGTIISSYYPLDKYGSADIDSFIAGFIADPRGFDPEVKTGGEVSVEGETSLGGIYFTKITRMDPSPLGTDFKDYCYIRVVNGMAHVLIFDYQGSGELWSSYLNNIGST